jgi:cell division cycle 20, cofactor of APC complex
MGEEPIPDCQLVKPAVYFFKSVDHRRGNDNLLQIWDVSMASSLPSVGHNQWLHRLEDRMAAVKALAWCRETCSPLAVVAAIGASNSSTHTHTGGYLNS